MKNLIKNVIRSFKNNKISLIGLIFLLFFGLGAFCVMSNTTANISNQYTSIAKQGNLHDFTASELYEIGNAAYITSTDSKGFLYSVNDQGTGTATKQDPFVKSSTDLSALKAAPTDKGDYYYIVPTQTVKYSVLEGWTYTRSYKLKLDPAKSTGLFKQFATEGSKDYTEFEIKVNEVRGLLEPQSAVSKAVEDLQGDTWTSDQMKALVAANALATDYNYFLKGISDRTSMIFNIMTTKDTPLTRLLDSDTYKNEVQYRQFKSINVTATKDNIFYKVINSNPTDTIDKLILFKDPKGNYGNNLFNSTDWAPYNSQLKFYALSGEEVPLGTKFEAFTVPTTFEELVQRPLVSRDTLISQDWTNDERFIYSQMMHIRFKRMLSGDMSSQTIGGIFEGIIETLAGVDKDIISYYLDFVKDDTDISDAYASYIEYQSDWAENIIISMNGNIVFNWLTPTPVTCTLVNWTSHFSVINPQHLQANNKHVIDPKCFNDFEPFREWYRVNYGSYPSGTIDQAVAIGWFNSLTNKQFDFWRRPSSMSEIEMVYTIYKKDGSGSTTVTVTKGTEEGQWYDLPEESVASCGNNYQIIWGCGLSPDFMYPVVDITRPTPNLKTECLTYVNDAGYKAIRLAFFNSPVEDFLIAKFMPSVTTTRQQQIIDELNKFCAENMLYPKEVKAVYLANDTANVLNSSAFRVSYIPNLVSVIQLVTIILSSFLAILALVICLIIIKRYVENNRVNIGIMRANGYSKMKIALSLMPFAFFPALIGGFAAYLIGLFLQIPMLKLFGNYWTLPTPVLGFDWVSMLVCIFLPFIFFGIVTIIATLIVLRAKSVDLMKSGSEFKTNSFSKIAKKPFRHFGVLTRFRVALAFNSLSRLIVLALMSCLTMTSLVFAMTSFGKLNKSQVINSSQFDYSFNLKLTTPTTVGGNYNVEDWTKKVDDDKYRGYGYANPAEYIYNVSWDTSTAEAPDAKYLTKWYSNNTLELIDLTHEYRDAIGDNGNLMLPTMADATGQKEDLQYLMNKTCSKLTLDYVVGLGSLSSNPWEIALALMPANSRNLAADAYNTIVEKIGTYISNDDPKWVKYFDFFTPDPTDPTKLAKPYSLDVSTKSWLSRFSDKYAQFLVDIYTTPEFIMDEYRITYGIIPINWFKESDDQKDDELYTYITGKFNKLSSKQRPGFDSNHEVTIEGIKRDSDFIKLTDNNGNDLNKLLYDTADEQDYNWIIVNAYAAHKYNLGVNSTFSINMTNMADRYDRQIHPEEFKKEGAKSDVANFKVLAISQGTNGEAFYCKQKAANQLLGLPDGESWNSTHKYMLWQESSSDPVEVIDMAANKDNKYNIYAVGSDGKVTSTEEIDRFNDVTPTGFNGIYTQNKSGKPLNQGLSLYSYNGLYPGSSVYESDSMRTLLKTGNNLAIANFMTGINDPEIYDVYRQYKIDKTITTEEEYIAKGVQPFINELRKYFGDTTMVTSICGATDVEASDLIYKNLISTFNLAETTIMSVIIPITIIVVGIISNLIINDSKKMAAMLKALGYSDRKNAMSILALFVPTIVLGLALAIPASMGICVGYQSLIFGSANILIDVSRKWWYYLASVGGIGVILVATYVVGWISLKRDRLVDQIKN